MVSSRTREHSLDHSPLTITLSLQQLSNRTGVYVCVCGCGCGCGYVWGWVCGCGCAHVFMAMEPTRANLHASLIRLL